MTSAAEGNTAKWPRAGPSRRVEGGRTRLERRAAHSISSELAPMAVLLLLLLDGGGDGEVRGIMGSIQSGWALKAAAATKRHRASARLGCSL